MNTTRKSIIAYCGISSLDDAVQKEFLTALDKWLAPADRAKSARRAMKNNLDWEYIVDRIFFDLEL